MKTSYFVLLVLLIGLVAAENNCTSSQVYVKFLKQSGYYANEESWTVSIGDEVIYTSPSLTDGELRTIETCLATSTNNQYTLTLSDLWSDSWSSGAWLEIQGAYGNTVFKSFMVGASTDTFILSLYNPIPESAEWKFSSTYSANWYTSTFSDSDWTTVTLGSVTGTYSNPHYYRYSFTGVANLAAYEARFYYKFGLVVYLNGNEIYRENMAAGEITSSSLANGSYSNYEYRGFVRPASEISTGTNVLAVSVHFMTATEETPDLNAWLSIYGPSTLTDNCYVIPFTPTIVQDSSSTSTIQGIQYFFDFDRFDGAFSTQVSEVPFIINVEFPSDVKTYVNAMRIWPYAQPENQAKSFTLGGNTAGTTYNNIMTGNDLSYTSNTFTTVFGYFNSALYNRYQVSINEVTGSNLYLYEWQFAVCNVAAPTSLSFPNSPYSFYATYYEVNIAPSFVVSGCTISPDLPNGLSLNADTCTITGIATTASAQQTYTVTATMTAATLMGTFQLTITSCAGTFVEILRTYQSSASYEAFTVINADNEDVLFSVAAGTIQPSTVSDVSYYLCMTVDRAGVDVDSSSTTYWTTGSFLYARALLDTSSKETLLRARMDAYIGLPQSYFFRPSYISATNQAWYYKMGEIPSNWYGTDTANWQSGSAGSFTESTNRFQIYKRTFSITSLANVAGFTISLKYKYGCIIYLNNVEVFRNGVTGDLSTTTQDTNAYETLMFRTISLPLKSIPVGSATSQTYLQVGNNNIAIALIAINDIFTESTFDCAVNLMAADEVSRVFDFTTSGMCGIITSVYFNYALDEYHSSPFYCSSGNNNEFIVTFNNDRRETITSLTVQSRYNSLSYAATGFVVRGRNGSGDWTTLKTVSGLNWSMTNQQKKVWLENNTPYNQYSFLNVAIGDTSDAVYIQRVVMHVDNIAVTIPALSYEATTVYKDIEMSEVYPNSSYYTAFQVSPALPTGVSLDPETGMISGTVSVEMPQTNYIITAKKITGESVTATFSLTSIVCTGGMSLITLKVRTDGYPGEMSGYVYSGRGITGTLITSVDPFSVTSGYQYIDMCLNDGIYTFEGQDSWGDGWSAPAGFMLSVDLGELLYDMRMVPSTTSKPSRVTTVFSSYLPFQAEYSTYKILKEATAAPDSWTAVSFDDAAWTEAKAANIGTNNAVTTYIRKTFDIPNLSDYQVMNLRMKYEGGVAVYMNGNLVARFNLDETFNHDTTASSVHDAGTFSKFHIVLSSAGAVAGNNVIAFEIHRPADQSSSDPIVFDATAVFGVEECSTVVDSVTNLSGDITSATLTNVFDMDPSTYATFTNSLDKYLQWEVENLVGSKFNQYGLWTTSTGTGNGFSLYGRDNREEDWTSMSAEVGVTYTNRVFVGLSVPVGLISFRYFKWEMDVAGTSTPVVYDMNFKYCKASGDACPAIDVYPSVAEGQVSPAACPYGYRGYSYRECTNGQLGEVKLDKCEYKIPTDLSYGRSSKTVVLGVSTVITAPRYENIITRFYIDEGITLPQGLTLNESTGEISGIATTVQEMTSYTIYGENPKGATSVEIQITVRKGECPAEGNFPKTEVGTVAEYHCSEQGAYVGTQKRSCVLGSADGEWQKTTGTCMSIVLIVVLVIIILVIILAIVFFLIRTKKTKAVGGVKNGKMQAKKTNKAVKV